MIADDFVWHRATPGQPLQIVTDLAKRFDATFPRAQSVIALGNNDSDCGDYGSPSRAHLRAVARAWEPLVNRDDLFEWDRDRVLTRVVGRERRREPL